jgi:hypothetical protein
MDMHEQDSITRQQAAGRIRIQRTWPQLGRELYNLECKTLNTKGDRNEQQKKELRERLRAAIIEQCGAYEQPYEAYELVRAGRAAEIVGNPHYLDRDGKEHALPYTGLEGYYAGSEARPDRPGITKEYIIEEEANVGRELVKNIKRRCVENYSWASFARMKRALKGKSADVVDLRQIDLLWTEVVRRLHLRVYQNEEARGTPLEQLEILMNNDSKLARDRLLQDERMRLLEEEKQMSKEEQEAALAMRRAQESIFRSRLEEFTRFREETYGRLKDFCGRVRHIDYQIDDTSFADANIVETLSLPQPEDRNRFPPYLVHLAPEQLEDYLFLAHLGEKGGDPLIRSVLLTPESC